MSTPLRYPLLLTLDGDRRCVLSTPQLRLASSELRGTTHLAGDDGRVVARSRAFLLADVRDAIPFSGDAAEAGAINLEAFGAEDEAQLLPMVGRRYRAHTTSSTYIGTVAEHVIRGSGTLVMLAIEQGTTLALDAATVRFEEVA